MGLLTIAGFECETSCALGPYKLRGRSCWVCLHLPPLYGLLATTSATAARAAKMKRGRRAWLSATAHHPTGAAEEDARECFWGWVGERGGRGTTQSAMPSYAHQHIHQHCCSCRLPASSLGDSMGPVRRNRLEPDFLRRGVCQKHPETDDS